MLWFDLIALGRPTWNSRNNSSDSNKNVLRDDQGFCLIVCLLVYACLVCLFMCLFHFELIAFHAAGRRVQTTGQKLYKLCKKMLTLWNFVTIFGATMRNTFKWVQSPRLLLVPPKIREIGAKMSEIWESKHNFAQ